MTVTTTANTILYAGNGTTRAFAFPYIFFAPGNLVVTLIDTATQLAISPPPILNGGTTYDYTVSGTVTHGEYASGGTVTFNTAPISGYTVSLVRIVPAIQTVDLVDNAKFPAETINTEFDYLTVLCQQTVAGGGGSGGGEGTGNFTASGTRPLSAFLATVIFGTIVNGNTGLWYNSANGFYVPPAGKFYLYTSMAVSNPTVPTNVQIFIRKNGVAVVGSAVTTSAATFVDTVECSTNIDANGTDFFDVVAQGTASTNANNMVFGAFALSGLVGERGPEGIAGGTFPVGTVVDFAGSTAPVGWYLCNGGARSTTTDAALFSVIGYAYGGAGASFNLPDLRGRTVAGLDNMGGGAVGRIGPYFSPNGTTLGATGGAESVTLTLAQTPSHNHTLPGGVFFNAGSGALYGGFASGANNINYYGQTDVAGGGGGHSNVQPTLLMNKIIKA